MFSWKTPCTFWGNTTSMCLVVWMTALWLTHSVVCFYHCRYRENTELLDVCAMQDRSVKRLNYLSSAERSMVHDKVLDLCASQVDVENSQDETATQSQSVSIIIIHLVWVVSLEVCMHVHLLNQQVRTTPSSLNMNQSSWRFSSTWQQVMLIWMVALCYGRKITPCFYPMYLNWLGKCWLFKVPL